MEQLQVVKLISCPICESKDINSFIICCDHSCSKHDFNLDKCNSCGFVFTNPRPTEETNGLYYKFDDYISHTNSSNGITGSIYRFVRKLNLKRKFKVLSKHNCGNKVLDVGCGTGFFPKYLMAKGYNVTGLEPDADARKFAVEVNKINALPLDALNKLESKFNCITMWHVLEHVYHLRIQLSTLTSLVAPGGIFVIALPNYKCYDAKHYGKFWAGYDVPRHLYHFDEETITSLMSKYNFEKIEVIPMKFDAYYVSLLSQKHMGKPSKTLGYRIGRLSNKLANKKQYPYSSQIYVFKNKH